jgi:tetratricopeptide (TPR) repeat protein
MDQPQTTLTIEQAMQIAMAQHQAGRLAQAESIYRQIISANPNHAMAINLLAILANQIGRFDVSLDLARRAVSLDPNSAHFRCSLGNALQALGRADEAVAEFRSGISLDPNHLDCLNNLGNALVARNELDESLALLRRAISIKPDFPEALNNMGNALIARRDLEQAVSILRSAVELRPQSPEILNTLGTALQANGQTEQAITTLQKALSLRPDYPQALNNLANALADRGDFPAAVEAARRAVTLQPTYAEAWSNLGTALQQTKESDPAIAAFRKAIELKSDFSIAHFNLGIALLLAGRFDQGWPEYECRRGRPEALPDMAGLKGKTILLHAEQGLGDTIQFARFIPMVAKLGARVILHCHSELARLLETVDGVEQVVTPADQTPESDLRFPLMSLPRHFQTTLQTIPNATPYLRADGELSSRWRKRLPGNSVKVGLVWSGRRTPNPRRSIPLTELTPLTQVPGISLVSLQVGEVAKDPATIPGFENVLDFTGEIHDFSDTAALIENLDLVISIDTAVAHLAGAMGKPVWVLLQFVPDWRWMLDRADSPWYPSMRLFRQPSFGDWRTPIMQVAQELSQWRK